MGYTTKFSGKFKIEPALSLPHRAELKTRIDEEEWPDGAPKRSYCQWVPTKDGAALEWDGGEKFYHYDEWLSFLAEHLKAQGYAVSGSVVFRGESRDDVGTLSILDGTVKKEPLAPKPWTDVPASVRKTIRGKVDDMLADADSDAEADGWRAVLATLGEPTP